jgi:hypothetical protein
MHAIDWTASFEERSLQGPVRAKRFLCGRRQIGVSLSRTHRLSRTFVNHVQSRSIAIERRRSIAIIVFQFRSTPIPIQCDIEMQEIAIFLRLFGATLGSLEEMTCFPPFRLSVHPPAFNCCVPTTSLFPELTYHRVEVEAKL